MTKIMTTRIKFPFLLFFISLFSFFCESISANSADSLLIAHWSFDAIENGQVKDLTGNGHDGTLNGNATIINDPERGNVASFDGNGDFIEVLHKTDLSFNSSGKYTVIVWVKIASIGTDWQGIMNKSRDNGNWWGFWISKNNQWYIGGSNTSSGQVVADNKWHQLAFVQDDNKVSLYLDGDLLETGYKFSQTGNGNLWFGGAAGTNEWFKVKLDDAYIYNRAMPYSEILETNGKENQTLINISDVKPHTTRGDGSVASFKIVRDREDKALTIRFNKTTTASVNDVEGGIPDSIVMLPGELEKVVFIKAVDHPFLKTIENIKFTIKADPGYTVNGRSDATIYIHDIITDKFSMNEDDIINGINGGMIGQMAGVTWGALTEFSGQGKMLSDSEVPLSNAINDAFGQDDLYVEIPFMNAMNENGVNCSWKIFGDYFKTSTFQLWHANLAGRNNLQSGIDAPSSGHYSNNFHCDDIDWQIEADFVGQACPNMPIAAVDIAWRAGHVMNYGDGVYGGVFMASMHSAAFTAASVDEIINVGLSAIPVGSKFRQVLDDVIAWKNEGKTWQQTWQALQSKWGTTDRCPDGINNVFNIDSKLNSAYVLIGLLYGNGDFEQSMRIAIQCGQDSDCNPSSVGGILGNWLGETNIPDKWQKNLIKTGTKFSYTTYDYTKIININLDLAKKVLAMSGGSITNKVWSFPHESSVTPLILEQWPTVTNSLPKLYVKAVTVGNTVTFKARATDTDGIASYQWFFGDLSYATGDSVVHEYASLPSSYKPICYVTDKIGNTSWIYGDADNFYASLDENINDASLKVYPNPILGNYLTVNAGNIFLEGCTDFVLYDIFGRNLCQQKLFSNHDRIELGNILLPGAIYFVEVKSRKGTAKKTILKF